MSKNCYSLQLYNKILKKIKNTGRKKKKKTFFTPKNCFEKKKNRKKMRKKKLKKIIKKYFKKSDIPKNDLSIYENQFYITYMLFFFTFSGWYKRKTSH